MTWICEFCGWENPNDDRIALKEPSCIRCGRRRGERTAQIAELEADIKRLQEWDREYTAKITRYHALIEDLRAQLAEAEDEHDRTVREQHLSFQELQEKMEKLRALKAGDPPSRMIAEDQVLLVVVE